MIGPGDIIDKLLSEVDGLTSKQAADACLTLFETISASLASGRRVRIPQFGDFYVKEDRVEREGVHPVTGETIVLPASKDVRFKSARGLRDLIND